jgi:hypothetical protein
MPTDSEGRQLYDLHRELLRKHGLLAAGWRRCEPKARRAWEDFAKYVQLRDASADERAEQAAWMSKL